MTAPSSFSRLSLCALAVALALPASAAEYHFRVSATGLVAPAAPSAPSAPCAQCAEQAVLAASDGTTVTSKVSATEFRLANTSGQGSPGEVAVGAVLKGGLATPECKGDFTLTFKAPKLAGNQGFLGITVTNGGYANQVNAGYRSLVEQAMYHGNYLLRRMVNYDYIGFGAGPVTYALSRSGNVVTGTIQGILSEAVTLTTPPATLRGFIYFTQHATAAPNSAEVSLTDVQFSCPGG